MERRKVRVGEKGDVHKADSRREAGRRGADPWGRQ